MLVIIYILAFFIVGLFGITVQAHYHVNYVTEITVEPLKDTPIVEYKLAGGHTREELVNEQDPDHDRYNRVYRYCAAYEPGLILGFRIQVQPENSTYGKFETIYTEKPTVFELERKDESTIYLHIHKKGSINLIFQSTDGNRTETQVQITVFKEGTNLDQ